MNERSLNYLVVNKLERILKEYSSVILIDACTSEEFAESVGIGHCVYPPERCPICTL